MARLPWDLIVDILRRLPVKDLLRYRCVSKPWCSLIDGPDFIKKHLSHSMETFSNTGIVLRDCDLRWVDLYALDSAVKLSDPMGYIIFGFGYDPINDDYKLVRMVQFFGRDSDSFDSEVKVYSAKSNTWKRISDFPYYLCYKRGYGVLASNALHWVVSQTPESDISKFIVAFDLVTEEYREVPQPDYVDEDFHMNVEVLRGSLCMLCNYVSDDPEAGWGSRSHHVDIWVMTEYGVKESWTKMFTVVPSDAIGSFDHVLPLAYLKTGDEVLLNHNGKKFISYDLETKEAKNVIITGVPDYLEAYICVESLVGLNDSDMEISWKQGCETRKKKNNQRQRKKKRQSSGKKR
ncbi:F-box domain containing protein [Trema orientale]|uniref:F-box domain containing protein n=1 Tax=Trema orientale TaxID=63057 RepID=A0A2P5CCL2_TREOI|nr:F-box domain containing protein [Trema orientale]